MAQLIITAVGPDKPGLVGELSAHLATAGANILDSRMVNLRGQFALLMLVEGPADTLAGLEQTLPAAGENIGLNLTLRPQPAAAAGGAAAAAQGVPFRLKTYSMDQPGLVHAVTDVLRTYHVNIEELTTRQESASFAGTPLFTMEMRLTVPLQVAVRTLRRDLEAACEKMNCDVDLEPV